MTPVDKAIEALEPFAARFRSLNHPGRDDTEWSAIFANWGDLRRASDALSALKGSSCSSPLLAPSDATPEDDDAPRPTSHVVGDWCQPSDGQGRARPRLWMVRFEDAERGDVVFTEDDAEQQARDYFHRANISWNCTLWASAPVPASPSLGQEDVERVARIIDPDAWEEHDGHRQAAADLRTGSGYEGLARHFIDQREAKADDAVEDSLTKARAILAAIAGENQHPDDHSQAAKVDASQGDL